MEVLASKYINGSGGCRNLFFRAKGTEYFSRGDDYPQTATDDIYVIQWEGYPDYDSGYASYEYVSYDTAIESFDSWDEI